MVAREVEGSARLPAIALNRLEVCETAVVPHVETRRGALTEVVGGQRYLKMVDDRCAALAIERGVFVCTVYELRPQPCRALDAGSPACEAERADRSSISRVAAGLSWPTGAVPW